jgi:hypothetical protein
MEDFMKPTEYIDKTMREAIARMPSTPEERDAYQKGMIARMADIEQKLKIHADNPAHVKQLKDEWNRLNGLFLASFNRSEPKQENETAESEIPKYPKVGDYMVSNDGKGESHKIDGVWISQGAFGYISAFDGGDGWGYLSDLTYDKETGKWNYKGSAISRKF